MEAARRCQSPGRPPGDGIVLDASVTEGNELDFVPSDWKPGDSVVWKQRNEVPLILDKPLMHSWLQFLHLKDFWFPGGYFSSLLLSKSVFRFDNLTF